MSRLTQELMPQLIKIKMAERVGFEPTVQFPAHMISNHACSTNSSISPKTTKLFKAMEQTGFEPVTSSVRGMRSPN
jgi:hypothetical protein